MNPATRRIVLLAVICVAMLASEGAFAAKRVALVIGNGAYRTIPALQNSRNDADDVSAQLKRVGFEVVDGRDLTREAMLASLSTFAQRLRGTEAALVYYAGHGLQMSGKNYLLPVDAKFENRQLTHVDLVRLDDVIAALEQTSGVRLLILDACRDNPIAATMPAGPYGPTPGLAKIERTQGLLIAYATQANAVASDGNGRNSPFTAALVREIAVPGLEIGAMFRRVAINVNRETNGEQTPELSVSLLQDFYMNPQETDLDAWTRLGPRAGRPELEAFMARFPGSSLFAAAQSRIDAIESAARQEQLVREFEDKERTLRARLEQFEAGYRKATEELAQLRIRDTRPAAGTTSPARPPPSQGDGAVAASAEAGQRQADAEKAQRLTSIIASLDADKARVAAERAELEKAMRESIARAQVRREQAERRAEAEVARLPPAAAMSAPAPAAAARPRALTCRELNARAQLGELSDGDRDILRNQCR